MYLFENVINRLKEELTLNTDKQVYEIMGVTQGVFSNWRTRNKIPYEELTTICFNRNIDLKYIISGQKELKCINYKEQLIKMIDDLDNKKSEIYYHLIKAEILKEKL